MLLNVLCVGAIVFLLWGNGVAVRSGRWGK